MAEKNKKLDKSNEVSAYELAMLEEDLKAIKKEHGIEQKEGRISRAISDFFERKDAKAKIPLKKKTYLLLAIFTGWMGGHRFYAKQYPVALFYLLLCWCGIGAAMTIVDLLVVIPIEADENGIILM